MGAEDLNLAALEPWLQANLPGFSGPVEAIKFASGQSNPTYLLRSPGQSYVLRRKPLGTLLKSAHAVDREFRVQKALAETNVPVARMYALCEDESIIGAMFYVMAHVEGDNHDDPRLPGLTPEARGTLFDSMNKALAALHDVDPAAVGLSDYGPEGNYFARQLGRWSKQYRASQTEEIAAMDALIAALEERLPADDGQRGLVHGDYRLDNLICDPATHEVKAILDWELSTLGHPYADLAGVIMQWQMPPGAEGRGLAGVDRRALGLPEDEAFIADYCARRGIDGIDDFGFYLGFCFFRMAAILQGVKKRALEGNASNPESGLRMGAFIPEFAARGLKALGHD